VQFVIFCAFIYDAVLPCVGMYCLQLQNIDNSNWSWSEMLLLFVVLCRLLRAVTLS